MFDIWSKGDTLAEEVYQKGNFEVEHNNVSLKDGHCVIYCSSNNIWFPNEKSDFIDSIIKKNRFEWKQVDCKIASKNIYIRDIYKSWYVTGMNKSISSIDKLISFLKEEVFGYKVIVIGSSSGGYLASILGQGLNAEHVIAFSAQFELNNKWAIEVNPYLQKYTSDPLRTKYYDLKPMLEESSVPIYYVVPIKNKVDLHQYNYIAGVACIKPIIFSSRYHGVVMLKSNLSPFISMKTGDLEDLYLNCKGNVNSVLLFSVRMVGLIKTLTDVFKEVKKRLK